MWRKGWGGPVVLCFDHFPFNKVYRPLHSIPMAGVLDGLSIDKMILRKFFGGCSW